MTLSEIRKLLNDEDIMLTKSLGQTFMHDQNQLRKIVALAKLAPDDSVIEIGPGLGPLTELLLEAVGQVTAIETDRRLIKLLEKQFSKRENLTLQHADAMKIVRKTEFDWSEHKLVANLPYSITDAQIREAFAACGRLASVEWLNHRDSSHFKGSGFLTFETAEAAAAAVKLDGTKVSKRPMRVDLAASAAPPSAGAPTCVYVGNLPFGTDEKGLRAAFSSCGGILSVMIIKKGKASLRFKTAEGAAAAAARDGEVWEERPLRIIPTNALGDVGGNKSAEGKGKGKGKGSSGGRGGGDRGGGDAGGRGGGVLAVGEAAAAQAPASAAEPEGGEAPRLSAHARRKGPRERAREHAQRAAALE